MIVRAIAAAALLALSACGQPNAAKSETTNAVKEEAPAPAFSVDALFADGGCYLATYDDAHLIAHPQQTVTTFMILQASPEARALDTDTAKHLAFAFQIKEDADIYTGLGACTPNGPRGACYIEGDGGEFTLTPSATGLRVEIARMEVEGPERFAPNLADGDNRSLELSRGSGTDCMID